MRNYNDEVEAAYLFSRRQGNLMRDREREQSPHEDRSNRYRSQQYAGEAGRGDWETIDSYRTADSDYNQMLRTNRGKGPKNYRRADSRIREDVCDYFCDDPYLDASGVDVEVKDREVILTGTVEDRFAKIRAEELAESVSGVTNVENRIHVEQDKKQSYRGDRVNVETE